MAEINKPEEEYEENPAITLDFDDGESVDCEALFIFSVGDREYIALSPLGQDESSEYEDIYLYEYFETGEDEFELGNIEDDDVFNRVSEEFDRILEEEIETEED